MKFDLSNENDAARFQLYVYKLANNRVSINSYYLGDPIKYKIFSDKMHEMILRGNKIEFSAEDTDEVVLVEHDPSALHNPVPSSSDVKKEDSCPDTVVSEQLSIPFTTVPLTGFTGCLPAVLTSPSPTRTPLKVGDHVFAYSHSGAVLTSYDVLRHNGGGANCGYSSKCIKFECIIISDNMIDTYVVQSVGSGVHYSVSYDSVSI